MASGSIHKSLADHVHMTKPMIPCDLVVIGGKSPCGKTTLLLTWELAGEYLTPGYIFADYSHHVRRWHLDPINMSPLRDMCISHKAIIDRGELIPDDDVNQLMMYYLHTQERNIINEQRILQSLSGKEKPLGIKLLVTSGWPRTKKQFELAESFFKSVRLVYIESSHEKAAELRDLRATHEERTDDNAASAIKRTDVYETHIRPAFEDFTKRNPEKIIPVMFEKPLTQKVRLVVRRTISCPRAKSSLLSNIEPRNSSIVTKASAFIAEIEARSRLQATAS